MRRLLHHKTITPNIPRAPAQIEHKKIRKLIAKICCNDLWLDLAILTWNVCLFLFHCFTWQGLACSWKTRAIARPAWFHLVRLVLQRLATALAGYVGGNFLKQSTVVATPVLNFPSNDSKQLMLIFLTDRKPDLFFFLTCLIGWGGVRTCPNIFDAT